MLYPQFVIWRSDYNLIFLEAFTRFLSLLFTLLRKVHIEKPWICLLSLRVKEGLVWGGQGGQETPIPLTRHKAPSLALLL